MPDLPAEVRAAIAGALRARATPESNAERVLAALFEAGFRFSRKRSLPPAAQVKGGINRAKSLTPERRAEIARRAANARWGHGKRSRRNG